jgi:hypothetical protein
MGNSFGVDDHDILTEEPRVNEFPYVTIQHILICKWAVLRTIFSPPF